MPNFFELVNKDNNPIGSVILNGAKRGRPKNKIGPIVEKKDPVYYYKGDKVLESVNYKRIFEEDKVRRTLIGEKIMENLDNLTFADGKSVGTEFLNLLDTMCVAITTENQRAELAFKGDKKNNPNPYVANENIMKVIRGLEYVGLFTNHIIKDVFLTNGIKQLDYEVKVDASKKYLEEKIDDKKRINIKRKRVEEYEVVVKRPAIVIDGFNSASPSKTASPVGSAVVDVEKFGGETCYNIEKEKCNGDVGKRSADFYFTKKNGKICGNHAFCESCCEYIFKQFEPKCPCCMNYVDNSVLVDKYHNKKPKKDKQKLASDAMQLEDDDDKDSIYLPDGEDYENKK